MTNTVLIATNHWTHSHLLLGQYITHHLTISILRSQYMFS